MSDHTHERNTSKKAMIFKDLSKAVLYFLQLYSRRFQSPVFEYTAFITFMKKSMENPGHETNIGSLLSHDVESDVLSQLEFLHQTRKCIIENKNNRISTLTFPGYFYDAIRERIAKMEHDIHVPFPSEENLKLTIPIQFVTVINVRTDFLLALSQAQSEEIEPRIMRLLIPENIPPIIITSEYLQKKLLELSIYKMRLYMEDQKNATYMEHKLASVIKQKDIAIREMIANLLTKTENIIQSFFDPNELSFAFWAHLTNLIIQEYSKKDNKLPKENDFCQAAHLISLYNIYFKGTQQREKEKQIAFKIIEKSLGNSPFIFSISDIYRFKDKNGFPIIRKVTKNEINEYLKKMLQPERQDELPELMQLKTVDRSEFYIHRLSVLPFCVKLVFEASVELKKWYLARWEYFLKNYRKLKPMLDDFEFQKDVESQLASRYPVLVSLLNYELLYMARRASAQNPERVGDVERLFTKKRDGLMPITYILRLNRKELYLEARSHLPFLETLPIIGGIIVTLKRLFWGKKLKERELQYQEKPGKKESAKILDTSVGELSEVQDMEEDDSHVSANPAHNHESQEVYTRAINRLENKLVRDQGSIDQKLEDLAGKWNPLFDAVGKAHLLDDVNSIIRDYLKNLRQSFRVKPPDEQRIKVLAETLARNKSFDKIIKKQFFVPYIEIYMVKILRERIFAKKRFR
jgi:hypothetical protein